MAQQRLKADFEEFVVYRFSANNINVESLTRGKPQGPV